MQECLEDRWLRTEFSDHRFEFRLGSVDADRFDQRRGFIESLCVGCISWIDRGGNRLAEQAAALGVGDDRLVCGHTDLLHGLPEVHECFSMEQGREY